MLVVKVACACSGMWVGLSEHLVRLHALPLFSSLTWYVFSAGWSEDGGNLVWMGRGWSQVSVTEQDSSLHPGWCLVRHSAHCGHYLWSIRPGSDLYVMKLKYEQEDNAWELVFKPKDLWIFVFQHSPLVINYRKGLLTSSYVYKFGISGKIEYIN